MLRFFSILAASALLSSGAEASCYREAAKRYGIAEGLLRAIAKVESGSNDAKTFVNVNADGSRDIGRMQINTSWLPVLARYGIGEKELRDECTSITVGAWIISQNITQLGLNWDAVGAYNVGCRKLTKDECQKRRNEYAWKVFHQLRPSEKSPSKQFAVIPAASKRNIGSVTFNVEDAAQNE